MPKEINESEKQSRVLRLKYNKRFINRIIIVKSKDNDKTWKGKIVSALDHETFSVENHSKPEKPVLEVDIYDIVRVIWEFLSHCFNCTDKARMSHSGAPQNKTPRNRGFSFGIVDA